MMKLISLVFLLLQLNTIRPLSVEETEDANLLVVKNILNNYIVEGLDVEVRYNIYNTGNMYESLFFVFFKNNYSTKLIDQL